MTLVVMLFTTASAWAQFSGGSGTSTNPYQITNASDLAQLATNVNAGNKYTDKYFVQKANITALTTMATIGSSGTPFCGHYDGGGFTISDLTQPLFGTIQKGETGYQQYTLSEVKDLTISGAEISINVTSGTPGFLARAVDAYVSITNCHVVGSTMTITGTDANCGGLIGTVTNTDANYPTTISGCSVTGTSITNNISGQYCGGLFGVLATRKNVYDNFVEATLTGDNKGGIAGKLTNTTDPSDYQDNYYHAAEGLIAIASQTDNGETAVCALSGVPSGVTVTPAALLTRDAKNYYAVGDVTLTIDDANKAFLSFSVSGATYSVATNKKSATVTLATSDATVTAEIKTITGSCGDNATWTMSDADSDGTYETLTISGTGAITSSPWATDFAADIKRVNISSADLTISDNPFSTLGEGAVIVVPTPAYAVSYSSAAYASKLRVALGSYLFTATNEGGTAAYEIANEVDLRHLSAAVKATGNVSVGKTFRQTADITMTGGNFYPIGRGGGKYSFQGTYDGQGHTISGLTVSETFGYLGLFGLINGATVRNVRLVSPSVRATDSGNNYTDLGALIGMCGSSGTNTVENCVVVSPTLTIDHAGSEKCLGAIIGQIWDSNTTVSNCYYYDAAHNYALVGLNDDGGHLTNVARARKVTLGDNVTVSPAASDPVNGFVYNNERYYREGLQLTLSTDRTGYTATFSAGGNAIGGSTYTVNSTDGDVTITAAAYTANTYTVHFDKNHNDATGSMSDMNLTYDIAQTLTANAFTRTGYVFAGWATEANGAVVYSDQQSVSNLTATDGGSVTLYAKWGIPYLDADGQTQICADYTVLTGGGETTLPGGWYVATGDITYTGTVTFTGTAHLILADGCHMNIGTSESRVSGFGFKYSFSANRTIYSQSTGSNAGALGIYTTGDGNRGIDAYGLTINGGNITADADGDAAVALCVNTDGITINGGTVNAKATGNNAVAILSSSTGGVNINGGKVTAIGTTSGIGAYGTNGNITLGYTNLGDYIKASNYNFNNIYPGTFKVKDGQTLYDGNGHSYSGTLFNGQTPAQGQYATFDALNDDLAGKTLRPVVALADNADNSTAISAYDGQTVPVALLGRTLYKDGAWNTLCLPFDVDLTADGCPLAGATLMKLDTEGTYNGKQTGLANDGTLYLYFKTATSIEAGKPYIIKWDSGSNIENPVFTGVTIDKNASTEVTFSGGKFKGTYSPIEWDTENKSILFLGSGNTLYYPKPNGGQNPHLNAFRAYFDLGTSQAREFVLNFDGDNEATGIKTTNSTNYTNSDAWYDMSGRKLSGKPTKAGLYIHGNRKVVIK